MHDWLLSSYQKQVTCQNIPVNKFFIFGLNEGHKTARNKFVKILQIKAKRKSRKFIIVIGFFGDGQRKSQNLLVFAERSFSKNSYYIETSELTCVAIQLTGICMMWVFTERYFGTDNNDNFLIALARKSYLWQWLIMLSKVGLRRASRLITMLKSDWTNKKTWSMFKLVLYYLTRPMVCIFKLCYFSA